MLQIKLPTKITFWSAAVTLAGFLGMLMQSGIVPEKYIGVVGALATLVGAILQHKPADETGGAP